MSPPTVPGCVRCVDAPGHEGVHIPEYATEENGLLPRRKPKRNRPPATRVEDLDPNSVL